MCDSLQHTYRKRFRVDLFKAEWHSVLDLDIMQLPWLLSQFESESNMIIQGWNSVETQILLSLFIYVFHSGTCSSS